MSTGRLEVNARGAVSYDKSVARTVVGRFHVESLVVEMYALQRVHMKQQIDLRRSEKHITRNYLFECLNVFTGVSLIRFDPLSLNCVCLICLCLFCFSEMLNVTFILYVQSERVCNFVYMGYAANLGRVHLVHSLPIIQSLRGCWRPHSDAIVSCLQTSSDTDYLINSEPRDHTSSNESNNYDCQVIKSQDAKTKVIRSTIHQTYTCLLVIAMKNPSASLTCPSSAVMSHWQCIFGLYWDLLIHNSPDFPVNATLAPWHAVTSEKRDIRQQLIGALGSTRKWL